MIFYKAKSYWKDGNDSTWELQSNFDKDSLYEELKKDQDVVRETHKRYIGSEDDTLFLFYKDGDKDFSGRNNIEIVALRSVKKFNNKNAVYEILTNHIDNLFDDSWEYEVEIDDSYIVKNRNSDAVSNDKSILLKAKKYILFFSILLALFYIFILPDDTSSKDEKSIEPSKKDTKTTTIENNSSTEPINNTLDNLKDDINKTTQTPWEWKEFCSKYRVDKPEYCYQKYIVEKCEKKEAFSDNYEGFFLSQQEKKDNSSFLCEDIKEIEEDSDLMKSEPWKDKKYFFKD